MNKKKLVRIVLTIVIIAAAGFAIGSVLVSNKKENEAKTAIVAQADGSVAVRVVEVKKQPLQQDFTANGNFIPSQQLNFSSENSGRVTQVLVDEGSRVSKGQTLAIIKADQLNVDVESAQAAYQVAQKDKERYENAFKTGGVTQQQVDQAILALSNAEAKLAQAKIKVGDTYVRSSINGIVNKRLIEPGAVVAPGTELFELVDVSRLKLQATVNEGQVAQLKEGDKVNIHVSVFPDKEFTGKVTFIAPKADATLSFPIEVELAANPGNLVKAGMYATAIFSFPSQAPVITIPRSSFVGSVSSNQLFVVGKDSSASLKKVIAGRVMGDQVEVLQGLSEGESVITSGQINLNDGTKVSIVK
ncbi:efflux RND transporter periplasmic adaptor subunit [Terrimonas sp. NA20]|uniref:Efflux RND transporter periplasmic adaptor subunit n=1 Tax=Terrimonas ginsenosidimutans TaxID=2908004 RepID=A0ABS9KW62_9BACT|nr:efflux RND transporter periplasmic adaptor subunit [Terrimonas ginsenosidimutans]MCG2616581.1 efflux RND transporter periplasmic adaptor subunit [Terrimonas ginsenosidimutans]